MGFFKRRQPVEVAREDHEDTYATYEGIDLATAHDMTVFGFTLPGSKVTLLVEGECGVAQLDAMIALLGSYRSQVEASIKAQADAEAKEAPKASNTILPSERSKWAPKYGNGKGDYPKTPARNLP